MANLSELHQLVNYMMEKHPDLAEEDVWADHEKIYLPKPDSNDEFEHLIEKGKQFGLFISEEDDSLIIFV